VAVVATTQAEKATINHAGGPVVAEEAIKCEVAAAHRMPQVVGISRHSRRSKHLSMSRRRILGWHSSNNRCTVKSQLRKRFR
jgi:ribosomal protein L21